MEREKERGRERGELTGKDRYCKEEVDRETD